MAGNFERMGVQAVVEGMAQFERDMQKIGTSVKDIERDLQKWAQAQLQGTTQGAKAADELYRKYEKLAQQQRDMATYWTAKGKFQVAEQHVKEAASLQTLADKYREASRAGDELNQTKSKMSALSDMVQEKWAQLAAAGGVLVGGLRGIQQFFEMGAAGAGVQQTAVSFDRLIASLGGTADTLNRMRTATGYTISDTELMASTMTVLAGGSEDVNKSLVAALPQLLSIAKAANALNPSLGSTAYMFDSITRGIKRGSPLILDNLGIVVKVGQAQKEYADSLGVSVEALDDEAKVMALLNAVLDKGDNLIQQVGGSTESLVDPTARMDAAFKNLGDTMKASVAPAAARAAEALTLLLTGHERLTNALETHNTEVAQSATSYPAYVEEMKRAAEVGGRLALTQEQYNTLLEGTDRQRGYAINSIVLLSEAEWQGGQATEAAARSVTVLGDAADRTYPLIQPMTSAMAALRDKGRETASAYASANTNLAKTIETMLTNIKWVAGGGDDLQRTAEKINEAAAKGVITPEQAEAMFEEVQLAALDLQQDLGLIKPSDAVTEAAKLLGTDYTTAANALKDIKTRVGEIPAKIESQIRVAVTWYLKNTMPEHGQQHGGAFTVKGRGGADSQLVQFMATPGEIVTVSQPHYSGSSVTDQRSVNVGNVNVNNGMTASAFDQMMRQWLGA